MSKLKIIFLSETFRYLFFGGLSTLVYALVKWASWQSWQSGWGSEVGAQATAIVFAFFTNKFFVFHHKSSHLLRDFLSFVASRIFLLLLAVLLNWWLVDQNPQLLMNIFGISKNTMVAALNIFIQVLIIAINYLISKFLIFRQNKKESLSPD